MHILLVDDHPIVRHGIRQILQDRLKGSVVGEERGSDRGAGSGEGQLMGCRRCRHLAASHERNEPDPAAPPRHTRPYDAGCQHAPGSRSLRSGLTAGEFGFIDEESWLRNS